MTDPGRRPPALPYTLVRSQRRTLALTIDPSGALTARAPQRMPRRDIEAFIAQKRDWIAKKQAQVREKARQKPRWELSQGGSIPFWGHTLTVRFAELSRPRLEDGVLLLPSSKPAHSALAAWLRVQAPSLLGERVQRQARAMGLAPSAISYASPRTRWGSMSGRGALRLNLALLLCPPEVADYVILHELAHMPQPNHSPAFWQLVAQWMPGYQDRRAWLKQNSHLIGLLQKPEGPGP